ncbi:T-lymphocyte activation antigen CD80-like isoform 2-T2 [Polymixia lowei]
MLVLISKPQFSLSSPYALLWTLVLAWLFYPSVTGQINIKGEVGGNVTFLCDSNKQMPLHILYIQKGSEFLNGYHDSKELPSNERTVMDPTNRTMNMWDLKVSDSGTYTCHIKYKGQEKREADDTIINLNVTASYCTPTLIEYCDSTENSTCWVTCSSHGGYPASKVIWNLRATMNVTSDHQLFVKSSVNSDPDSMLVNSSSTIYLNCTHGPVSISCTVGDASSKELKICKRIKPGVPAVQWTIIIAIGVAFSMLLAAILVCRRYRRSHVRNGDVKAEELDTLNDVNGGKEAP